MALLCKKELCTGCLACVKSCRKGAVTVRVDNLGFAYPTIDRDLCVDCGACAKACHVLNPVRLSSPAAYYRYKGPEEERLLSASGAFFPLLAETMLKKGYYVCGVVFEKDHLSAKYVLTNRAEDIPAMRKSKYVEADLGDIFVQIKALLENGGKVLFAGLPCHCAALRKLVTDTDDLVLADMLCHGSGSPSLFRECVKDFLNENGHSPDALQKIVFRYKPCDFNEHKISISADDRQYVLRYSEFPYYFGYANALLFRESCYQCMYKTPERASDLTFCDSTLAQTDAYGESIVFVNTPKGQEIIKALSETHAFIGLTKEEEETTRSRIRKNRIPRIRLIVGQKAKYKKVKKYLSPDFRKFSVADKLVYLKARTEKKLKAR